MNKINDINGVKYISMTFDNLSFTLVFQYILAIFIIYFLYLKCSQLMLKRKMNFLNNKNIKDSKKIEKQNIYNDILLLSENNGNIGKDLFYADLNLLFRRYFVYLGVSGAYNMTLKELQCEELDSKIFELFTKSYMYEFSLEQDNLPKRKQILMNFMIYLKK